MSGFGPLDRTIGHSALEHPRRTYLASAPAMHALSIRLSGKRLYIADLAVRLEQMESGRTPMNAIAYRLYARRMATAMDGYPPGLLAAQLGRTHPAVLHAIEQRRFVVDGAIGGPRAEKAQRAARALLWELGGRHGRAPPP
jgi:hypothetical protein